MTLSDSNDYSYALMVLANIADIVEQTEKTIESINTLILDNTSSEAIIATKSRVYELILRSLEKAVYSVNYTW